MELKISNIRNLMRIYCFGINLIFTSVILFAGMVDEEDDQTSSWESEPEGENAEDKDKGSKGKGKGKGKGKSETRHCYACGEQGHIGVKCPYKWTNSIDEECDQVFSSWEREHGGVETIRTREFGDT